MAEQNQNNQNQQDTRALLQVRREKLAALQEAGKDPFQITSYDQTHHAAEVKKLYSEHEAKLLEGRPRLNMEGMDEAAVKEAINADYQDRRAIMDADPINVSVAGRMMFKRVMGKASFCNIRDLSGDIQVYVAKDSVGDEAYAEFKKSDIGDIYGVKGYAFRTKTGELSIHATEITLLTKSLQILPEKYHGITNTDLRYRQRYVDLIMNPEVKDTFLKRSKIISSIRRYLDGQNFIEVETPMLVSNAGGAAARPFETHFNALGEDLRLRISLELYLKRLIVGGMERVYEIGRVFRNEGLDTRHNPEFTLMELYQAYTDYNGMMDLTENMFRHVAQEVLGTTKFQYGEIEIDFGQPFARITMREAVKKYAGVDWDTVETLDDARAIAKEKNVEFEEHHKKGDILSLLFEEFAEAAGHPVDKNTLYGVLYNKALEGAADCDGLKTINDAEGHKAGDEALAALGRCFLDTLNFRHPAYRVGGDEFLVVCRDTSREETEQLVEDLRRNIGETGYSCAVGYSVLEDGAGSVEDLLREADSMMYMKKREYYITSGHDRRRRTSREDDGRGA